jgi:hypothetical protein
MRKFMAGFGGSGTDVNSFLEDMAEKHDLLADPIAELGSRIRRLRDILQAGAKPVDQRASLRVPAKNTTG